MGEDSGSARRESQPHGHVGASWCRGHPTSPAHRLAGAVAEGIDAEALVQRRRPTKASGLSQPFLAQEREHGLVCLALHARREEPEIPDVVPVAVGHVIGERGQELRRRAGGLDGAFRARVLRHKTDFLTADRPEPMLGDRGPSGIAARIPQKLLFTPEPLNINVPPPFVLGGE